MLGFSTTTGNQSLSEEMLAYSKLSDDELGKIKMSEMKLILKEYGQKVGGRKDELIKWIKLGPVSFEQDGTILDEIVKCWFMKPLKRTKPMRLGIVNEESVIKSLSSFITTNADSSFISVTKDPVLFGLVKRHDAT